jgi:hypothetical protein
LKFPISYKDLLISILSGNYSNQDIKNFAKFCFSLSLPLIRKKILLGKINLQILGMSQNEIVVDCIADIFSRDNENHFYRIKSYFENLSDKPEILSEEEIFILFRRFIFNEVHNNLIRLYSEADPALGKIIRNMKISLNKNPLFTQITRFGEVYLIPEGVDVLWNKPALPFDQLQNFFSKAATVYDNIPEMMKKLYEALIEQEDYQRTASFVSTALLFKEVYVLGWKYENQENIDKNILTELENDDIKIIINKVCEKIKKSMFQSYVAKGKVNEYTFSKYITALSDILTNSFANKVNETGSYFESLKNQIPELTKEDYTCNHRTIIEYLAKIGKERMQIELKKL